MYKYLLLVVLLVSFSVRLINISAPMADLHSWRQADTAAVAKNFTKYGFGFLLPDCGDRTRAKGFIEVACSPHLLYPEIYSSVSIDGIGRVNEQRYHFAEFPVYQAFVAVGAFVLDVPAIRDSVRFVFGIPDALSAWKDRCLPSKVELQQGVVRNCSIVNPLEYANTFYFDPVVYSGRVVSIFSSLVTIFTLYYLVRRYFGRRIALSSAAMLGLLPFSVFWSRTVLPDPMMVMFCVLFLYFFDGAVRYGRLRDKILAILFFSLSLLLKPFVLFLGLPVLYIVWKRYGNRFYTVKWLWVLVIVGFLPFLFWRVWIQQQPMSIPASSWLFDGKNLRLKPAWWHWIVQVRLDQYMFNAPGLFLLGLGFLFNKEMIWHWSRRYVWFFPLTLISCFVYLVVFATGNVTHEYYQLPITVFGSVLISVGLWYLIRMKGMWWEQWLRRSVGFILICIMLLLGNYTVKDWYSIGNPLLVQVGMRADKILPKDAVVIADYGGDTTFIYYVNRPGWSVREMQLQELIDRGATHYISMHRNDYMNRLATLYKIVDETPEYVILDLRERTGDWTGIEPYSL